MADIDLYRLSQPFVTTQQTYAGLIDGSNSTTTSLAGDYEYDENWNVVRQQPVQFPPPSIPQTILLPDVNTHVQHEPTKLHGTEEKIIEAEVPWPADDEHLPEMLPQAASTAATPLPVITTTTTIPATVKKEEDDTLPTTEEGWVERLTERSRKRKPTKTAEPSSIAVAAGKSGDKKKEPKSVDEAPPPSMYTTIKSWFLTFIHAIAYAYEKIHYCAITFINDTVFVNGKWKWLVALSMDDDQVVEYSFLGKKEVSFPRWYRWFRQAFAIFVGFVIALSLFIFIWYPYAAIMTNALVGTEIQQVYMDTPLEPVYVKDFINDFAYSATFESSRLARIKNRENAMEDAETDAEREALDAYDRTDRDGDGTYDKYEAKSFADVHLAGGLGMKGLEDSFWGISNNYDADDDRNVQREARLEPTQQIRVEPIMPLPLFMCDLHPQYYRMQTNIVLRKGCYDMIQFALDMTYNQRWLCKQAQAKEIRQEAQRQGRAYVGMLDKYIAQCRAEEQAAQNAQIGSAEQICITNVHYGMTQPWVYSATPGREPIFLINPKIVPMNYSDFTKQAETALDDKEGAINPFDHMQAFTIVEDADTTLGKIDKIFYGTLKTDPNVRQPPNQILVDAYTLAGRDTMREYFGDIYGSSITAYLDARSILMQDVKEAEKHQVGGQFNAVLNKAGHYFKRKLETDPEATSHDSINVIIMQTRAKIESLRRKTLSAALSAETNSTVDQIWGSLSSLVGGHYETKNAAENRRLMELETPALRKRTNLPILAPHSTCVIKSIQMDDALMLERQKTFDKTVTYVKIDKYTLPEQNFVTRK